MKRFPSIDAWLDDVLRPDLIAVTPDTTARPRTVADVLADLNLDEALEQAVTPTCEATDLNTNEPSCAERAEWLCSLSCGHSAFMCTAHSDELRASMAEWEAGHIVTSFECAYPATAEPWHPRPMLVTVNFDRIAS